MNGYVPRDKPIHDILVFFPGIHGLRHIPLGKFNFVVEYFSEVRRKWLVIGEYELEIWDWIKERLAAGDGFVLSSKGNRTQRSRQIIDNNRIILDTEIEKSLESEE